jgi:hypothetical protein
MSNSLTRTDYRSAAHGSRSSELQTFLIRCAYVVTESSFVEPTDQQVAAGVTTMEEPSGHAVIPGDSRDIPQPIAVPIVVDTAPPIRKVQLEGLVVLKIIKHCQENFPMTVMGQLLGMDIDETLEITNCYPFMTQTVNAVTGPEASESATAFEVIQQQYQRDMMFHVREGESNTSIPANVWIVLLVKFSLTLTVPL